MLFNSYSFIFLFAPVVFLVMFWLSPHRQLVAVWLAVGSLVFYAVWSIEYLPLLIISIVVNYLIGRRISFGISSGQTKSARRWMWAGIASNLLLLCYFKYANFIFENLQPLLGASVSAPNVTLPIGISFFTFTQIAYLVDAQRGATREYDLTRYGLFVSYFPHLIAGPILHHREMIEQFVKSDAFRFSSRNVAPGLTLFTMGLVKKVIFADSIAPAADAIFAVSGTTVPLLAGEAWVGVLAYSMQIYFDFSGYSDMALGLGLMMGIRLPLNFSSPYQAFSIIDFWRRWHMSLSRFLRDYLYIPLGGGRRGTLRRYGNVMITMLLGGLWHGASWTFVIWGGLHGLYLVINHIWRVSGIQASGQIARLLCWLLTFFAVNIAWVFFRSDSVAGAFNYLSAMFGLNGQPLPWWFARPLHLISGIEVASGSTFGHGLFDVSLILPMLAGLVAIALFLPNSQTLLASFKPSLEEVASGRFVSWEPNLCWGILVGSMFAICTMWLGGDSPFLYFRF